MPINRHHIIALLAMGAAVVAEVVTCSGHAES